MPMWGTCIDYDSIDHLCGRSGIHCGQEKPACHGYSDSRLKREDAVKLTSSPHGVLRGLSDSDLLNAVRSIKGR